MATQQQGTAAGAGTRTTVVGVFDRRDQAERAVEELAAAGFRDDQIGLVVRGEEGGNVAGRSAEESTSDAGGGVATGAVLGGVLGAIAALVIPGVGPVLALGTLGTVLAGAAVGAGVGAVAGGLVGMGVPADEAEYYEGEFQSGKTIVTVNAGNKYNDAQNVLRRAGGHDVETRGARPDATPAAPAATPAQPRERATGDTVELREKELRVNKERVQTGQVEIGKRVVEEQKTIDVPVTREEVVVERRPVNQPAEAPITGDGRTISVPVSEERVSVEKQTVVIEEIGVQKRVEQDTVPVNETVRREEAVVNTTGDVGAAGQGASTVRWEDAMPAFRQHWQSGASTTGRWEDAEPAYRFGYDQYTGGQHRGRGWADVEPALRRDWESRYPGRAWDTAANAIKHTWDHLTGASHTSTR